MKLNTLTILAILLFLIINGFAQQVPRQMVVLEIGTGTWCQYCPGAAMGADELIENGHNVAVVEYHTYDAYQTTQSEERIYDFYNMYAFPTAIFDGVITDLSNSHTNSVYEAYLPHYEERIAIMSDLSISLSFTNTGGNNYSAHVNVENVNAWTGSAVLQLALTESNIPENWQGMEDLDFVCRLMLPDANGTALDFTGSNTQEFDFDFALEAGWLAENCELTAFVQEIDSKEILQGNKISLAWQPSSDASLSDLTVDDESIEGFDPETYYYEYWVASGTQIPPTVNGMVNHPGATIEITQANAIPGSATIFVTAEDGATQLEYEVAFLMELSNDATLSNITIFGESLAGFNPSTFYYAYLVPPGTQVPPTVNGMVNHPEATIEITQASAIPGSAHLIVTAEDGAAQLEYEVVFLMELSNDATLSNITIDGESLSDFNPLTFYYAYLVPSGTLIPPSVGGMVNHPDATIEITQASAIPGTATILVTAEDGNTQLEYEVVFLMELSNDASLSDITLNAVSMVGFDPEIYYYEYWVASGTQVPPSVNAVVNHTGATIEITQASAIPGTATILVTAEDGSTQLEYEVVFLMELSNDASLSDLTVDEISLADFDPEIYSYEYWVASGTTVPPTVDGIKNQAGASIEITQAIAIPGSATILVIAEDGSTQLEYEVDFDFSIGMGEVENQDFFFYPNPAKDWINIQICSPSLIRISDANGIIIIDQWLEGSQELPVSKLKKGIYFITIQNQKFVIKNKLIIAD